ncbi:MAG: hypothetical protein RIR79_370 [Pseudomonadota bacterium]|jgi:predicted nucleic acid-binding protein
MKNVVDSCGWLEFILGGENQDFFQSVLADKSNLLVVPITVYEVCKRILLLHDQRHADTVFRAMAAFPMIETDAACMFRAAIASKERGLHMADAIIWQTAQSHNALLYTQDAAFQGLPGVVYRAKSSIV